MKMKKIPMRSCVVTKEKLPKQELVRVVRTPEGNVIVDLNEEDNGRRAYVKKDMEVINKARKSKVLERVLEVEVKEEVYEELERIC